MAGLYLREMQKLGLIRRAERRYGHRPREAADPLGGLGSVWCC
jgi:hypothetical protein